MPAATQAWCWFGVSERGPAHIRDGRPNEDVWRGFRLGRECGVGIVVCDGVGSVPMARFGAATACDSTARAIAFWRRTHGASTRHLGALITSLWQIAIGAVDEASCATTCLFAFVTSDKRLITGQLGDGLIVFSGPGDTFEMLSRPRVGPGNATAALGGGYDAADWTICERPGHLPGTAVLLATDGIGDDIREGREARFLTLVRDHIGTYGVAGARARLRRMLRRWPTPGHRDDKTLALLWLADRTAQQT